MGTYQFDVVFRVGVECDGSGNKLADYGPPGDPRAPGWRSDILGLLAAHYGGATCYDAQGVWMKPDALSPQGSLLICERVLVFECLAEVEAEYVSQAENRAFTIAREVAREIATAAHQECVAVSVTPTRYTFAQNAALSREDKS